MCIHAQILAQRIRCLCRGLWLDSARSSKPIQMRDSTGFRQLTLDKKRLLTERVVSIMNWRNKVDILLYGLNKVFIISIIGP